MKSFILKYLFLSGIVLVISSCKGGATKLTLMMKMRRLKRTNAGNGYHGE